MISRSITTECVTRAEEPMLRPTLSRLLLHKAYVKVAKRMSDSRLASDSKDMLRDSLHQRPRHLLCAAVNLMLDLCSDCQVVHCAVPEHDWSGLTNPWSKASNCVRTRPFHSGPASLIPNTGVNTTLSSRVNKHCSLSLQTLPKPKTLHCGQLYKTPIVRSLVSQPD